MRSIISLIFTLLFILQIAFPSSIVAQTPPKMNNANPAAPEYVIYEFYFRRIAFMNDLSSKSDKNGLKSFNSSELIKKELAIDDAQYNVLSQISANALAKAADLDAKALVIIQSFKSQYPGGLLPNKEAAPKTPPELAELQLARNKIFANAIAQLSKQLAPTVFQAVDAKIKEKIVPKLEVKTPQTEK